MVIKMFISGISASKEVKKRQLRAQFLLESYKLKYETVDITDPACEEARAKMHREAKRRNGDNIPPQPPQFYNEDDYCGDFEDMETANDNDDLFKFLKLEEDISIENGTASEGEYDLFKPPSTEETDESLVPEVPEEPEEPVKEDEDEIVDQEVREQCTINGVVYTIPKDRMINVGGRIINVDELLANDAETISLDDVDEELKEGLVPNTQNTTTTSDNEEEEDEEEE